MSGNGCEDGHTWTSLRDVWEVELANVVIIHMGEQEKGIEKIAQGSDVARGNTIH